MIYFKTSKDPRLKLPGVFVLAKELMKADIKKRIREVQWTTEHSLTAEQFQKLIMQKVKRAEVAVAQRSCSARPELRG